MSQLVPYAACPACGTASQPWQRYCYNCGTALPNPGGPPPGPTAAAPHACPRCGTAVFAGQRVCAYCGLGLDNLSLQRWQAGQASAPPAPAQGLAAYAPPVQNYNYYQQVIVYQPKSIGLAVLLAILFGPLGMLYSTVAGALIMLVLTIPLVCTTGIFAPCLVWPASIVWAAVAAALSKQPRV